MPKQTPTPPLTFKPVGTSGLFTADDGEGRSRITIIRSASNPDPSILRVESASILIIGGYRTIDRLVSLMSEMGYPTLSAMWPGGMSTSTYTKLRQYLNVTERGVHGVRSH